MDLNKQFQQVLVELDSRQGKLDSRERTLEGRDRQLEQAESELAQAQDKLRADQAEVAKVTDVLALKAKLDTQEKNQLAAQVEINRKRQELAEWENRLVTIQANQKTKEGQITAREQAVSQKEANWEAEVRERFLDELNHKFFD